jgi:cytochrome c-type biogenesis protein CcmE
MKKTRNVLIIILAFVCGAGLLVWAAVDAQWVQTVSAKEVMDNPMAFKAKSLQIYGCIEPGSVKEAGGTTEFDLFWPRELQKPTQTLHVRYAGLTKVNLIGGSDVLIDCRLTEQGQAEATRILTKCPSKYVSRKAEDKK